MFVTAEGFHRESVAARDAGTLWSAAARRWAGIVLTGAGIIQFGLLFDISWHTSVGRDRLWTPAHIVLYLGGLLAAVGSLALFGRRNGGIAIGPARAPLGAWVVGWGGAAIFLSAPFDDWWHNAYGLDVTLMSPPHLVLLTGMMAVQLGALFLWSAIENGSSDRHARRARVIAGGLVVHMASFFLYLSSTRAHMHHPEFYILTGGILSFALLMTMPRDTPWALTRLAAVYMGVRLLAVWLLPLVPAEPVVGPVYRSIEHLVPPDFPPLLIFPAMAMDLAWSRWRAHSDGVKAAGLGLAFVLVLLVVQWPFAEFLMSPAARNPVFAAGNLAYNLSPGTYNARYLFRPVPGGAVGLAVGLLAAGGVSVLGARLGMAGGRWVRRLRR